MLLSTSTGPSSGANARREGLDQAARILALDDAEKVEDEEER